MADSGRAEEIRRLKTPEKEDLISALPDSLIHHILSFLPSTKQAVQTGILSKRWHNQWTFLTNLTFDFPDKSSDYSSVSRNIDQALIPRRRSKSIILKLINFAVYEDKPDILLPEFVFSHISLVRLQLSRCSIMPSGMVNWKSLKDLSIYDCGCSCEVIRSVVSGSPLLQSLELKFYLCRVDRLDIASKSLKRLVLGGIECSVDIWCPNLVEFDGSAFREENFGWCDEKLEKFLFESPLLETLELKDFVFSNLRIASTILKRLVLHVEISNKMQISCPHLEELDLFGCIEFISLMNIPSSVCAALDLICYELNNGTGAEQILKQLQHVNELKLQGNHIESLSALEIIGVSHVRRPLLTIKSLTLELYAFGPSSGILYALRSSPVLERLIVKLRPFKHQRLVDLSHLDHSAENYWNSNGTHLSSLLSHLRTVEIIGFSQREEKPKLVLDFVEFLLKSATVLEKLIVIFEDCGTDFVNKVSRKLSSFSRCSAANIELL